LEKYVIKPGVQLKGRVEISGSKNASLPILACTILAEGTYRFDNIPNLLDIRTMLKLLEELGMKCEQNNNIILINNDGIDKLIVSYELVKKMRASILVLAPLLAKKGKAKVSFPGGCAIGERPIDQHIKALRAMGANIDIQHGYIVADCKKLKGAEIFFDVNTVTGTENIIMAAVLAEGRTIINNAAQEPEVIDLCNFLKKMGAQISGIGTKTLVINGVNNLKSTDYSVIYDRIEAGTFLCILGACKGELIIENAPICFMKTSIEKLIEAGVVINIVNDYTLAAKVNCELKSADITTQPYPGFPTDMQAQFMALMTKAKGVSVITEGIFENRFMHVAELKRMGADIVLKNKSAIVKGIEDLSGTDVSATDLRAGAALVIAALQSNGESRVHNIEYIDRGYEEFEKKLNEVGVNIYRVKDSE
jgi:UDP-N-acetylglucosamine 1-carboxyvinyltransferase